MFSRKVCYFFVRPSKKYLEVVFFLGRPLKSPKVKKSGHSGKVKKKYWHSIRIVHRDEVEEPVTDWLRESYDFIPE
jgi:hypothetical protein